MNKNEKTLFLQLCNLHGFSPGIIKKLLQKGASTPAVLGFLFDNRMAAIAYRVLRDSRLLGYVSREFREALTNAYLLGVRRNEDYFRCLETVTAELERIQAPYALLKGAYLCARYPEGCRTAGDIDVLLREQDADSVTDQLIQAGFQPGRLRDGAVVRTERETCQLLFLPTGLPFLKTLRVDFYFSPDRCGADGQTVTQMLSRAERASAGFVTVRTLDRPDFILQLCAELFAQATDFRQIRMRRDMPFYRYLDLYTLLYGAGEQQLTELIRLADAYGLKRQALYGLRSVNAFYQLPLGKVPGLEPEHLLDDLDTVTASPGATRYRYIQSDPVTRFFSPDRTKLLWEIPT